MAPALLRLVSLGLAGRRKLRPMLLLLLPVDRLLHGLALQLGLLRSTLRWRLLHLLHLGKLQFLSLLGRLLLLLRLLLLGRRKQRLQWQVRLL